MSFLVILLFGILVSQAEVAKTHDPASCVDALINAIENKALVVDHQLGLLEIRGYDRENDRLRVRLADTHRRHVPSRGPEFLAPDELLNLENVSGRRIAEVGTSESGFLVGERAREQVGYLRAGGFFALNAILARLHATDEGAETWRALVWNEALKIVDQRRKKAGEPALGDDFLARLDFISVPKPEGADFAAFVSVVRVIYELSGEDLIHSGLLQNYAAGYRRNWRWSGKPVGQRSAIHLVKPTGGKLNHYIPQDVDHYVRSWLWAKSRALFGLRLNEDESYRESIGSYLDLKNLVVPAKVTRILPVGVELRRGLKSEPFVRYEIIKKQDEWVPVRESRIKVWQNLYEAAGSVRLPDADVMDETVLIVRSPKVNAYVDGEIQRKLFDAGAKRVLSVIWRGPQP